MKLMVVVLNLFMVMIRKYSDRICNWKVEIVCVSMKVWMLILLFLLGVGMSVFWLLLW